MRNRPRTGTPGFGGTLAPPPNRRSGGVSLPLLGLYTLASFLHFAHNGLMLDAYPNMPAWITAPGVYATWLGIAALGLAGYVLTRLDFHLTGMIVLALYAVTGLDGLAHYALAPITAHSFSMNFTIGFEVVTAILLLIAIGQAAWQLNSGDQVAELSGR